jgi:8-oxo-dGTP pyrophosphatase MutT (NUDIX family)
MSHRIGWGDVTAALDVRPARTLAVPCARRAAVALVLREADGRLELLFVRRAEHPRDPWSGHVAFPGGRAEPGDADLLATARRETSEEVGLDLASEADPLGALDEIQAMRRFAAVDLSIAPFVFRLRTRTPLTLSAEVVSVHWGALDFLIAPATRGTLAVTIDGQTRELPCLRVDGQTVWGLTLRMFDGLAERLEAVRAAPRDDAGEDP